jgi:hypothetical protein
MAKRRSSLKGRGSEILFGEPSPVEIEPRGTSLAFGETEPPGPEAAEFDAVEDLLAELPDEPLVSPSPEAPLPPDEEEWERALLEEARDGELAPGEAEDLSLVDELPPPTPEMEMAFYEEAVDAEEPPEPLVEAPPPTLETTMDELDIGEEEAFFEVPAPEVSDVASGVLPPRSEPTFFEWEDLESLTDYDVQAPGVGVVREELPERQLSEEDAARLIRRIGLTRLQELDREITKTYDQVLSKVGENEEIATDCYNQLLKARDILLRRDAARIPQAEYYVELVRSRLKRASESESGAQKYAWWITAWGFVWGALFLAVLFLLNHTWFHDLLAPSLAEVPVLSSEIFLRSMVWGGIGGVVAVLYSLFKHVGLRDFDAQYNLSYVGKPFLGLVLGATVYMIFQLMMTLGLLPAGLQTSSGTVSAVTPWIIYPLAWACGFKENRIFDLVDRVIKRIFKGEEAQEPEAAPEPG